MCSACHRRPAAVVHVSAHKWPAYAHLPVQLMGHVATRDAAQHAFSLPRSTDSSEPGQWMAERLPSRLHEWLVDPEQIEYLRW